MKYYHATDETGRIPADNHIDRQMQYKEVICITASGNTWMLEQPSHATAPL